MINFDNLTAVKDTATIIEHIGSRYYATKTGTHTFLLSTKINLAEIINVLRENGVNFGIYWYRKIAVLVLQR
jgi:hypothetical protein